MSRSLVLVPALSAALFFAPPSAAGGGDLCYDEERLVGGDTTSFDGFGDRVAISGDWAVASAAGNDTWGSAYVFRRTDDVWHQEQKLTTAGTFGLTDFGSSVDIDGDTIVVGGKRDYDGAPQGGAVWVFTRNGTVWSQQAKLTADDAVVASQLGASVSLYEDTLVAGAPLDSTQGSSAGSAYVFVRQGTTWSQQAKLLPAGTDALDRFGQAVEIHRDTVVVGAPGEDVGSDGSGRAYVYRRTGTQWISEGSLNGSEQGGSDAFGTDVAVWGETIWVGAPFADDEQGTVYSFVHLGGTWMEEQKLEATLSATSHMFGNSVAIEGGTGLAGSLIFNGDFTASGAIHLWTSAGGAWVERQELRPGNHDFYDFAGAVDISRWGIIGAAQQDDGSGTSAGAAYVFELDGAFELYGQGHAGSNGYVPELTGAGCPSSGTIAIQVTDGLAGVPGCLVFSVAESSLPFFGGELLVGTTFATLPHGLGGAGGVGGDGSALFWFEGVDPSIFGVDLHLQAGYVDPGASQLISLSNGLRILASAGS